MSMIFNSKTEYIDLLKRFNKEGTHLHSGLWTSKVVLIEDNSNFIRLDNMKLDEALPLLEKMQVSYPILLSAETPKDYLTVDVRITKNREGQHSMDIETTTMRPVQDFLVDEYKNQLDKFISVIAKNK